MILAKVMKASVNINMLIMMPCEVIGRIYLPFMGFNKKHSELKLGINEY
jgi:hypothetical protein